MIELYIGNKNFSTWSMRPWLVLEHFGIPYVENLIPMDDFSLDKPFKQTMLKVNPTGKVPAIVHQNLTVWDSLAICEYLADLYPEKLLWPQDLNVRAYARAITAEMHSSFQNLRTLCGMNIQKDLSEKGQQQWAEHEKLRREVQRIEEIWASRPHVNSFLCGDQFTIADAFYAPVVMRFMSYQLPISTQAQQYIKTILTVPAVQKWIEQANNEEVVDLLG